MLPWTRPLTVCEQNYVLMVVGVLFLFWFRLEFDFNTYSMDSGSYVQPNGSLSALEAKVGVHIVVNADWKSRSCCKPYIFESGRANFTATPMWVQAAIAMSKYYCIVTLTRRTEGLLQWWIQNFKLQIYGHYSWTLGHKWLVFYYVSYKSVLLNVGFDYSVSWTRKALAVNKLHNYY